MKKVLTKKKIAFSLVIVAILLVLATAVYAGGIHTVKIWRYRSEDNLNYQVYWNYNQPGPSEVLLWGKACDASYDTAIVRVWRPSSGADLAIGCWMARATPTPWVGHPAP